MPAAAGDKSQQGQQGAKDQLGALASLFSADMGQKLYEALKTKDWSAIGQSIGNSVANVVQGLLSGMGPFGQFFGGFVGAAVSDLISGAFGASKKHAPTESTFKAYIVNWPKSLEAGISLMPAFMLRAPQTIIVQAGNADARGIARYLSRELAVG